MPSAAPAVSLSSADASDIAKLVEDAQRHTLGNLSGIINELDRAMKTLQEAGVEAMQSGNFESVQLVMENTKRLKTTRDRLTQLLDEISSV
jgi:alpha-galactosidase/6-phospho-beta-glucosidase family protein